MGDRAGAPPMEDAEELRHHGRSREQILESQRERLLAAVAQEVATRGYRATTITDVVKQASVYEDCKEKG